MTAQNDAGPQSGAGAQEDRQTLTTSVTTSATTSGISRDLRTAALQYAAGGWPVFPCRPNGKAPLTEHGFHDATRDPERIWSWWTRHPNANIGVPTGEHTFNVLDVDVRKTRSGWPAFNRAKAAGLLCGAMAMVRTPSTGLHLYYFGVDQPCGSLPRQNLDFKASGGYVLMPPSYVVTADYEGRYELLERRPWPSVLKWSAIVALFAEPPAPRRPSVYGATSDLAPLVRYLHGCEEGNRNSSLFWACCRAVESGHNDLSELVDAAVSIGLPRREAERTAQSALRRGGHQ